MALHGQWSSGRLQLYDGDYSAIGGLGVDFGNINSEALLHGGGTETYPLVTSTADKKFISYYLKSTATSGDNRAMYLRFYLAGTGISGDCLRAYASVADVAAANAFGAHLSLGFETAGRITGLGAAMRGTLHIPDRTMAAGGTYAAVQAEIYSDGASSSPAPVTELSFLRLCNDGNAAGIATVDDKAYLFSLIGGANATGNVFYGNTLRCNVQGTAKYLVLSTAENIFKLTGGGRIDFSGVTPTADVVGSLITTGTTWVAHSTAGAAGIKVLLSNTSATGNFASLRIRARSDVATPTWNQNTIAGDFSASGGIANYGELVGVSAYAQDNAYNQARADHWATAVKACMLCTGTSTGSRFALVVSDYSTTKASTKHYLARFDKPVATTIDGVFAFGNCDQFTYFASLEVAGGYLTDSDSSKTTAAGALKVKTPAGDKYIVLYT